MFKLKTLVLLGGSVLLLAQGWAAEPAPQVTVYNKDLAVIRQYRTWSVPRGVSELNLEGVPSRVDPTSVKLTFPKASGKVKLLEQNYLYDLVSSQKIFEKYLGQTVIFRFENGGEVRGKLLNVDQDAVVIETTTGGLQIAAVRTILNYDFPALPQGLIIRPTLKWQVEAASTGAVEAEIVFLTGGMQWHAEYILALSRNETDFGLNSWVSLENNSGATYENAKVRVIAGDVHRVTRPAIARDVETMEYAVSAKGAFQERELMDYHLYELQRPVTLRDREIKQIALYDELRGKARKLYVLDNYRQAESEKPLTVYLKIENSVANGLGLPLPLGTVRIFQEDADNSLQLVGEDRLEHTSVNDTLWLQTGNAFDVKGKRIVRDLSRIKPNSEQATIEVEVRNARKVPVELEIREYLDGDWFLKSASHPSIRRSNRLLVFPLRLEAGQKTVVTYTYQRSW